MTKNFVKFTEKYKKGSVWGRPNKKIQLQEIKKDIKKCESCLTPREYSFLVMRFGLKDNTTHTLEEVGKWFCVTRERVRQIQAKALEKIRKFKEKK